MTGSEFFVTLIFLGSLDTRIVFLELKKFWMNKSHNLISSMEIKEQEGIKHNYFTFY